MSVQFYAYQDVAALLPQRKKVVVDDKTSFQGDLLQKFNVNDGKAATNWFPILIALGAIVVLGGLFLTLAAHQILPHGINAISNLEMWGQIGSYCTIGF